MAIDPVTGSIIIGGAMQLIGADAQNQGQRPWWEQINSQMDQQASSRRQEDLQKEFAQHGIRWRVEDAKRAGVSPLYALGAQTASYQPVQSVGDYGPPQGDPGMAAFADMGQNITRAMAATRTQDERMFSKIQLANAKADLDGRVIENQIKQYQLERLKGSGPAFPSGGDAIIPGQGNIPPGSMRVEPSKRTQSESSRPAQELGWRPDVGFSRGDDNILYPMVPEGLSESLEDDHIGKLMWRLRNQLLPNFGMGKPPGNPLPKTHEWTWDPVNQGWRAIRKKDRNTILNNIKNLR